MAAKRRYSDEQREAFWRLTEEGKTSHEIKALCEQGKAGLKEPFSPSDRSIRQVLAEMRKVKAKAARPNTIIALHRSAAGVLQAQLERYEAKLDKGQDLTPAEVTNASRILNLRMEGKPNRAKQPTKKAKDNGEGEASSAIKDLAEATKKNAGEQSRAEANGNGKHGSQSSEHASTPKQDRSSPVSEPISSRTT